MPGLNSVMDSSLSALFAAQAGMATTGHNIANANTPGYSRQSVHFAARRPDILPYGAIGRGVEVEGIRRIQDDFLLNNLRVQKARMESYSAVDSALYEVEAILGSVDNDHLGNALNNFFNSWNALAQPPINNTLKQDVVSSAISLVTDFHSINDSLDDLEANIENNIQSEIQNLNRLLEGVANMNGQIMAAESNGESANDLRDQRDLLITKVSEIAEVSVLERDDGTKDVILAGRTMVARDTVTKFQSTYVDTDDGYKMSIVTQGYHQEVSLSPGKLEGLLSSRDVHIKDVRDRLDSLASNVIEQVNSLHVQGRTSYSSGQTFFSGDSMHTIEVNPALDNNPNLVATGTTTAEGDNSIALAIADLANVGVGGPDAQSVGDEYRSMLTVVASKRNSYEFMVENQQNVVGSLETKMASVSGVSLDEEGANMVRYQNSYNAAAKIISTVQSMYDTLMNMV
ncbi:MAG: flagellar hook-associated protein FlgK [bacterium]|nr:flagellar hook-associated protein FlgK [bacterium]